jgi:hypothetical protein
MKSNEDPVWYKVVFILYISLLISKLFCENGCSEMNGWGGGGGGFRGTK